MSALHAEVYEAFRTLDVPDDKALKAAIALSAAMEKVEDETAKGFNKRDADIEAIRKDISSINKEVTGINTRLTALQGDMTGRITAMQGDMTGRITTMQGDVNGRITAMQGDVNGRMTAMQGEINLLKWMMGTMIAMLVTVMFRVFTH